MEFETTFNSKLLLFGEYGLMYNAMALSVPYAKYSGKLAFDTNSEHAESTAEIQKFFDYLKSKGSDQNLHFPINMDRLESDLNRGLYFDSNIPRQYGVGSSGALVAAIFSRYAFPAEMGNNLSPEILKANFAVLESFFHGKSSGLDPLISYLNKPIIIDSQKSISLVDFSIQQSSIAFALIDTHSKSATGPLVQHFIDLFNLPEFEKAFYRQFGPANNGCINSLLQNDSEAFFKHLQQLVKFELYHFHEMVPPPFHQILSDALRHEVYIKLLGSGGGGFLLAIAPSKAGLEKIANKYGLSVEWIQPVV
jgi:Mevalonate kinase